MNPGPNDRPSRPSAGDIKPLQDLSTQAIDAWISHLPLSDVSAACAAIHGLLRSVNMADGLECLERQRIIEQIRPPAVSLLAMSSEQHLPAPTLFPLSAPHRLRTQRNLEVCLELANAYRRIVTSGTFFSDKVMNETGRAHIVYRALQAYGLALLRSLERYESPPEGFWREVYAFYRFAEGHRLHNIRLPMPEINGATVDSQFKQMLLLALSSHQHHPPDEIRQFYTVLMLIAKDAAIRNTSELEGETALFYFDMASDNAPRPAKRAKSLQQGERRYLFTGLMLDNARQYFSNPAHRATDRFKLRPTVIMSLMETLAAAEKRRFVRRSASGVKRFAVGLSRLIDELSGTKPLPFSEVSKPEPSRLSLEEEPDELEIVLGQIGGTGPDEIWVKQGKGGVYPNKAAMVGGQGGIAESPGPASVELHGSLLNISAGGYCISWLNNRIAGARVGELIGIHEDGQRIHIGVIRWLHHRAEAELVIGVELSSPGVEAVSIETGPNTETLQRGLYVYANQKLDQPASLLCTPGIFKTGQNIILRGKGKHLHFHLAALLESTLSFQLFSLAQPNETPGHDPSQP